MEENPNDEPLTKSNSDEKTPLLAVDGEKAQNGAMPRSHLRKTLVKQSKKTLFLTGAGLLLLILVFIVFGQSLLVNFSVLLSQTREATQRSSGGEEEKIIYVPIPLLEPQPEATNSAKISVSGSISGESTPKIRLYVNDELTDVAETDSDGTFQFRDIPLKEGSNTLKAVAFLKDKTSDNSNILTVQYLKNAPELTVEYPEDGTVFTGGNKTLTIKGVTGKDCTVLVNDHIAVTKNDGSFTYNYTLNDGENKLKITSSDLAGNNTEKEITVSYSP